MASGDASQWQGPYADSFGDDDALVQNLGDFVLQQEVVNVPTVVMISRPNQNVWENDVIQPACRPAFPGTTVRSNARLDVARISQSTVLADQDYLLLRLSELASARADVSMPLPSRPGYGWSVPPAGTGEPLLAVSVLGICATTPQNSKEPQKMCMHTASDEAYDAKESVVVLHFKWIAGAHTFAAVGTYAPAPLSKFPQNRWTICAIECELDTVRRYAPSGFMMTGQLTETRHMGMQPLVPLMLRVSRMYSLYNTDGIYTPPAGRRDPCTVIVDTCSKDQLKNMHTKETNEDRLCEFHAQRQKTSVIPSASMLSNLASVPICGGMPEGATHDKACIPLVLCAVSSDARSVRAENAVNPLLFAKHAKTENTAVKGVTPLLDWRESAVHKKGEKQNEFFLTSNGDSLETSRSVVGMAGGVGNLALGRPSFWQTDTFFQAAAAKASLPRQAVALVSSVAIVTNLPATSWIQDANGTLSVPVADVSDVVVTVRTAVPICFADKTGWAVASYVLRLDKALLLGASVDMCPLGRDQPLVRYIAAQYEVHETVFSRVQAHFTGPSSLALLFSPSASPSVHVAAEFSMLTAYQTPDTMQNETCFAPFAAIDHFNRRSRHRLVHDRPPASFMVFRSPVTPLIAGQLVVCGQRVCALHCTLDSAQALTASHQAGPGYGVWTGSFFSDNAMYSMVPHETSTTTTVDMGADKPGTTVLPDLAMQSLQRPLAATETFNAWPVGLERGPDVAVNMHPYHAERFLKATVTVSLGTANDMCNLCVFRVQCYKHDDNSTVVCRVIVGTRANLSIPTWCFENVYNGRLLSAIKEADASAPEDGASAKVPAASSADLPPLGTPAVSALQSAGATAPPKKRASGQPRRPRPPKSDSQAQSDHRVFLPGLESADSHDPGQTADDGSHEWWKAQSPDQAAGNKQSSGGNRRHAAPEGARALATQLFQQFAQPPSSSQQAAPATGQQLPPPSSSQQLAPANTEPTAASSQPASGTSSATSSLKRRADGSPDGKPPSKALARSPTSAPLGGGLAPDASPLAAQALAGTDLKSVAEDLLLELLLAESLEGDMPPENQ